MPRFLWVFALLLLMSGCAKSKDSDISSILAERPDSDQLVFDYVGIAKDAKAYAERHLKSIRDRYQIEIIMAAVPTLAHQYTVSEAAVILFSNWQIGKRFNGRGMLMLLVDDIKIVKIEVGYELEDVFTDLFTGYIEDIQLQPHYAAGHLDIGLLAVMEEIEARSQLKYKGLYSSASVAGLDAQYLSQGGGARHVLEKQDQAVALNSPVNNRYPAGNTPREAWQTMIRHWKERSRDPFLGVYTPVTRLTYRDYTDLPDARFDEDFRRYSKKRFEIRQDGDYAVIYFGRKKGWENSPFFFCRTSEGWQFDIADQRRFIRMGPAPDWGIEFSEHPYMPLLMDAFHFIGQDIPLSGDDLYTVDRDAALAERILYHEALYNSNKDDFETMVALGRLYTIVSMSRRAMPLLKTARKHASEDARPYKYLAIAHVNAFYQYDAALKQLDDYIQRAPQDPFGYQFRGYLYYCQKAYKEAVEALETALQLAPQSCYAHFYLTYAYAGLYQQASKLNPRREHYKERFNYHREQTRSFEDRHPIRVAWLNRTYPGSAQ